MPIPIKSVKIDGFGSVSLKKKTKLNQVLWGNVDVDVLNNHDYIQGRGVCFRLVPKRVKGGGEISANRELF